MKQIGVVMAMIFAFSGCRGLISGNDYNATEIINVASFLGVSASRIEKFSQGQITFEDLNVSKERFIKAYQYAKSKTNK